jgi:processive 1,2-diacylglycerol beta-glucosyltransferase
LYAHLLQDLAQRGFPAVPRFNVVTDSISLNSLWWRAPCDGWFLPNADSTAVLQAAGAPAGRLHTTGFPVAPYFSDRAGAFTPPDLARGAAPRVLYLLNSGVRHAEETVRALFAESAWEVTCAVGRDARLRRRFERMAAGRSAPTTLLGWTASMPRLLMTHHAVVSKAGGATTQEAIAARCPMIVSQVVPGQEEGNVELLRRHGVGALAETPGRIVQTLRGAFANQGKLWREWHGALGALARPAAAADIARHVWEELGAPPAFAGAFSIPGTAVPARRDCPGTRT